MPTLATNKTVRGSYTILESLETGLVLTGPEVKSAKAGHVNLRGSYVTIAANEAWLIGAHINAYQPAGTAQKDYDPIRRRKLLLTKQQLDNLRGKTQQKGLTILPISVYTKGGLVKLEVVLGQGKKKYDKRAVLKKRDVDREISRALRAK